MYNIVWKWYVQAHKCSSINVQVEVGNYDSLYVDECLDMIHEDDDVMIHGDALYDTNALLRYLMYTLYWRYIPCHLKITYDDVQK